MSNILLPKPALGTPIAKGQLLSKGLVANYLFNEGRGDVLGDSSLEKNPGTITGPTWAGNGLSFEQDNADFVTLGLMDLRQWPNMTFVAIVSTTGEGTDEHSIISNFDFGADTTANMLFRIEPATNTIELSCYDSTNALQTLNATDLVIPVNTPTQVVAVFTAGAVLNVYVNGIKSAVTDSFLGWPVNPSANEMYIGNSSHNPANDGFDGIISDVKIYNRALNQSEIAALTINPNLPMQQPPIWLLTPPVDGIIPIIQAHARRRRAG